jgi:cyclopropane fatty-acyl-phospholipid synthase-like methyltransferase
VPAQRTGSGRPYYTSRRLLHFSVPYSLGIMADYDLLAVHYDAVTGDSASEANFIDRIIKQACGGRAVTLLEVACGTGGITARLADSYQVSGLDISPGMLAIARRKLPAGTPLHLADMSDFKLGATFDAIACVYHGINHLLSFSQWESFFDCAYRHLNPGGVLIFDTMTGPSLELMAKTRQPVQQFGDNYLLTKVRAGGEMLFDWETEVYELQPSGRYILLTEVITTAWFPDDNIRKALSRRFSDVTVIDSDGSVANNDNENRTWFVCTKSGS